MLSYRRETALQGALVLAKSGRLDHCNAMFSSLPSVPVQLIAWEDSSQKWCVMCRVEL